MRKWRTLHINGHIWKWTLSKNCYEVVIKNNKNYTKKLLISNVFDLEKNKYGESVYRIKPSKLKEYIIHKLC